jgi:hypothetical protein
MGRNSNNLPIIIIALVLSDNCHILSSPIQTIAQEAGNQESDIPQDPLNLTIRLFKY